MFKQGLRAHMDHEEKGYAQLRSDNSFRLADVVRYGNGGDQRDVVMDATIAHPTCATYIAKESHKIKLKAAAERHKDKMGLHEKRVGMFGQRNDYDFQPLSFETTGAMGEDAQKWWVGIVKEDTKLRKERGETSSRQINGLPCTWAANSFKSFWLQSFSMAQARTQARSVEVLVRKSCPHSGHISED